MKSKIILVVAFVFIAVMLLLPSGCITEFTAELPIKEDDILVVTGDIVENTEVEFVLSKSFSINSANPPGESQNIAATVTIVGSDGYQSQPATSLGKGVYRIAVGELNDDVAYGVKIIYYGNTYTSEPSKPLRTPEIDEVSWVQPGLFADVYLRMSTHDDSTSEPQYYLWNYQEDWEFPAERYTRLTWRQVGGELEIDTLNYNYRYNCWKKNTVTKILVGSTEALTENRLINQPLIDFSCQNERFRSLYCLTLTQKAISKDAYEYYSAKKTENEEMGGLFTPQPNEVKGNVICQTDPSKRTIGYVSVVKNVTLKRVFIYSKDITRRIYEKCPLLTKEEVLDSAAKKGLSLGDYATRQKLEPVGDWWWINAFMIEKDTTGFSSETCVDCVLSGGTKNKPDFWPNDKK